MDFTAPAQLVGYLAFFLGVIAFAQRLDWKLKFLVGSECVAYTAHFFLLGNNAAAVSAALASLRTFASLKTRSAWVAGFFLLANIVLGLAVATSWAAIFPIAAGVSGTVAVFFLRGVAMRLLLLCATLCWLTNNILSGSIGGTLLESSIALVNATTMLRLWWTGRVPQRTRRGAASPGPLRRGA